MAMTVRVVVVSSVLLLTFVAGWVSGLYMHYNVP